MTRAENTDRELDIVLALIAVVRSVMPDMTPLQAAEIEQRSRAQYQGQRFRVAKRGKHPTTEQRKKVVREALAQANADVPTAQLAESNGISQRSLYRYLKRGS